MNKLDIKITELHKQPFKNLQASQLVLEFKGNTVYPSVVNALRRLSLNEVPTYSFCNDSILIEENTSIFDNDYMRKRLEQLTVPNVNVPVVLLNDKYWRDVDYSNLEREKDPNDVIVLDLVINQKNHTDDVFNLTTNDVRLFQDGVDVSDKFDKNYPILLLKLRKGETFKCSAKAVLGKGFRNNIWAAAATAYHEYDDKHLIKFTIESQGQLDEYDILYRCCKIMKNKIEDIKNKLKENFSSSDITKQSYLRINFDKEDHTFGEVLNEFLQENSDVAFSGISKPDLLKNEITIKMKSVKNNPLTPLFDTMDYVIDIYDNIEKSLLSLGKKYILAK